MIPCTFAVMQILGNIGSLPFISWAISMKRLGYYFFKYPKIKYAISDRPHKLVMDLCETSF
jgi:hypothetical protein